MDQFCHSDPQSKVNRVLDICSQATETERDIIIAALINRKRRMSSPPTCRIFHVNPPMVDGIVNMPLMNRALEQVLPHNPDVVLEHTMLSLEEDSSPHKRPRTD
jgi:hypothetical protein